MELLWDDVTTEKNQTVSITSPFLPVLVRLLEAPVAVLVDEYNGVFDDSVERTRQYYFKFLQSLKVLLDYGKVHFAFITGFHKVKLNVEGQSTTSELGTALGIIDISDEPKFAHLLGFTKDEIETHYHLLAEHKAKVCNRSVRDIYDQIEHQYKGYQFGDDSSPLVYNPESKMKYLSVQRNSVGKSICANQVLFD